MKKLVIVFVRCVTLVYALSNCLHAAASDKPSIAAVGGQEKASSADTSATQGNVKNIYLNFENTSLINLVNYIAERKNINLIPDKGLENCKVSLTTREPMSLEGAWNVFLTLLEMSGFTIVEVGEVYKIVSKDKKLTEPLPVYINTKEDDIPASDLSIRYVGFLKNIQVAAVEDLLKNGLLSEKSAVYTNKETNSYVITDKALNIKTACKIINHFDTVGQPEAVVVMKLEQANAIDVQGLLDSLIKKPEGNALARFLGKPAEGTTDYFPPGTRIIADERTNSLILLGQAESIKKIEEFIVNHIDVGLKKSESPLHIYELQHTDAEQIAQILQDVTAIPEQGPGNQAAKYGAVRSGVKYFKAMKFQADKEGNRLLISCTDKHDWGMLKKIIDDLDKPQPQVALEVLIVSISEQDIEQLAGGMHNKKHGQFGIGVDFQSAAVSAQTQNDSAGSVLGSLLPSMLAKQGATLLSFGKRANIWAFLEMLKTCNSTTVLTQGFLTVMNKQSGSLTNGSTQYIPTSSTGTGGLQGYSAVKANQELKVTPQINLDGVIRLQLDYSNKTFNNALGNGATNESSFKTGVTVADGQALIVCGSMLSQYNETVQKTPLVSSIPIFGWFFKGHQLTTTKNYLFAFISPSIIKPRTRAGDNLYTKMKLHSVINTIDQAIESKKAPDPVMNWFFDPEHQGYVKKITDFAAARYQPVTVDIKNDPYYRTVGGKTLNKIQEETASPQEKITSDVVVSSASNKRDMVKEFVTDAIPLVTPEEQVKKHYDEKRSTIKELFDKTAPARSEGNALEDNLAQKRKRLKELVSTASFNKEASVDMKHDNSAAFKNFIAQGDSIAPDSAGGIGADL